MTRSLDDQAALDFVLSLRRRWADTVYPHLRTEFDRVRQDDRSAERELASTVRQLATYGWFSWLERGSQKMLWRAVADAVTHKAAENSAPASPGVPPHIDPAVALPQWYSNWDIHLQPGGIWSSKAAAEIYELGAKLVMMGDNDDYKFHRLFVETGLPSRQYKRVIDLGCGFGKSTWPLKSAFPEAAVTGVDLAVHCLELGAQRASDRGLEIAFRQADVCSTGLSDSSFDLVTSTMLVHEIPLNVLPNVFAEAARLLEPGGDLAFLDFQPTGDAFRDFAMMEHSTRNNEPFMAPMMAADLVQMALDAGLENAHWTAFDERGLGDLGQRSWPSRSEWHFPWAILHASAPHG